MARNSLREVDSNLVFLDVSEALLPSAENHFAIRNKIGKVDEPLKYLSLPYDGPREYAQSTVVRWGKIYQLGFPDVGTLDE